MTTKESLRLFEQLVKMKEEAITKLKKMASDISIEDVEITRIYISPADNIHELEELEIFLHMDLLLTIADVNTEKMEKLMDAGNVTLLDHDPVRITYATSYAFEYDEGEVTASFTGIA